MHVVVFFSLFCLSGPQGFPGVPGDRGLKGPGGRAGNSGLSGEKGDRGQYGSKGERVINICFLFLFTVCVFSSSLSFIRVMMVYYPSMDKTVFLVKRVPLAHAVFLVFPAAMVAR